MKTKKRIPVNTPLITKNDAMEVYKVVKSGWISSAGAKYQSLKKNSQNLFKEDLRVVFQVEQQLQKLQLKV